MATGRVVSSILSGIVSGLVFLLFHLYLDAGPWIAAAVTVAAFVGLSLIGDSIGSRRRVLLTDAGVADRESFDRLLSQGYAGIKEIRSLEGRIRNEEVRRKVEAICDIGDKILANIEKNPKDAGLARKFFTYYLDTAVKIVARYIEISRQNLNDPNVARTLQRAEGILDSIRDLFERQHARMFEDDVFDLDTEMELLEKTIKMEGL